MSEHTSQDQVRDLADRIWELRLDRSPVYASIIGDHRRDHLLDDYSQEALQESLSELREIQDQAAAIPQEGLEEQDAITLDLVIHQAETSIQAIESHYLLGVVDTFIGPPSSLLVGVNNLKAASTEQEEAYRERWSKMGSFIDQVIERHRQEFATGRYPAARVVRRVVSGIDSYLDTDTSTDPFAVSAAGGDEDSAGKARDVVSSTIRPAYRRYRDFLVEEAVPFARDDDHVGLLNVPDGERLYAELVRQYTSLPADPQELHDFGREEAEERLPEEWARVGSEALDTTNLDEIFSRIRTDPAFSYESGDEMVADALYTIERAWAVVDAWFGARPATPCDVKEVPHAVAPDLPPAYYMAPSSDGSRPGTYYINTYDPPSRKRPMFEAIHFHEAIPGHHFDRSLAMEIEGLPPFRQRFNAFAHIEGWGLYAERLADEMGLYTSALDRLGMLSADAWRAGRLVVDTGMHALGWSRQRAIEWMLKWTPVTPLVVEQEIDRYIGMAGQALAYKAGQREIIALRRQAEATLGERFDIKGFHDAVLTAGGLTLPVLNRRVQDWIERQA